MNAEPIFCRGHELPSVLADIRSRGGVVASLDTGIPSNSGYRVSYFQAESKNGEGMVVATDHPARGIKHSRKLDSLPSTNFERVADKPLSNEQRREEKCATHALNPFYGGKTISPKTPSGAEDSRQTNGGEAQRTHLQDCTAVNPSIEDRLAALQSRVEASGKLRRGKPSTPTEHARLPYSD